MKVTDPKRYASELQKQDALIQSNIDECKARKETSYFFGSLYPVFFDDICKLYEARGYTTKVKWEHGYDQDYTGITFTWQ